MASAYLDASLGINVVGARENFGGTGIDDLTAEEARYPFIVYSEGALKPADSFKPAKGAGMSLDFGSGAAKADYYVVEGDDPGQGNYVVRLAAATYNVTVDASDPSNDRTDVVFIVVRDDPYDALTTARADLYYLVGTPGSGEPAPLGTWTAYAKLCTLVVPATATDLSGATLTDTRVRAGFTILGDISAEDLALSGGITVGGTAVIDGVDVSAHDHSGAGQGGTIAHSSLSGLTTGDPHTQYVLESAHTKAAHDALNIDADTLDGQHGSYYATAAHNHTGVYATAAHNHDATYLGIAATAAAATKLATARSISLGGDASGSASFDGTANVTITAVVANDSHTHDTRYYTESESDGRFLNSGTHASSGAEVIVSTSAASGGTNGDIWLRY